MSSYRILACTGPAIAALLAACTAVGPDYRRPEPAAPSSWAQWHGGDADLASAPAASAPAGPAPAGPARWAALGGPVLVALEARAAAGNPDLRSAALHVAQARLLLVGARSFEGPQLEGRGAAARERQSDSGAATRMVDALGGGASQARLLQFLSTPFSLFQAGVDASWEPDFWGRLRRSVESSAAHADEAAALQAQARLVLEAEVARAYAGLRMQQRESSAVRDERAALADELGLLRARVRGGLADDTARLQAVQDEADLDARLEELRAAVAASLDRLALLCGEHPGALDELLAPEPAAAAWPEVPAPDPGSPADFLRGRPDVAAAERRLAAATADIGVAVADLYPRVVLGASAGFESLHATEFAQWGSRQWSVGPSLSLPLFDQGRRRAVVELRTLQQQEAAVAFQASVLAAWHDVDGALTAWSAAGRERAASAARRGAADDLLALAQVRRGRGLTDELPLLQARRAQAEARRAEAEALGRLAERSVAVVKALGDRSWIGEPDAAPRATP